MYNPIIVTYTTCHFKLPNGRSIQRYYFQGGNNYTVKLNISYVICLRTSPRLVGPHPSGEKPKRTQYLLHPIQMFLCILLPTLGQCCYSHVSAPGRIYHWECRSSNHNWEMVKLIHCASSGSSMGISLMAAAMGIPRRPKRMLTSHWCWVRGVVSAKSPRNWTMMNWRMTVPVRMPMKMKLSGRPFRTLISSMSLELISLNTWRQTQIQQ